jgi:uncharacterized membrane protein YdjX (TVP38/TMEM64 family)
MMTHSITSWFQQLGELSPISGVALGFFFVLAAFVVFPRTLLILTSGAVFGFWAAPIIVLGGATGGTLAFLLSRYVASAWFQRRLSTRPMLHEIARAVDQEGWRIIALMRLGTPIPHAVQNYLLGLTRIDVITYSVSTLIFSIPQICLFTFLGATGRSSLFDDRSSGLSLGFSLFAVVLLAAIIGLISWRVKQLLAARGIAVP